MTLKGPLFRLTLTLSVTATSISNLCHNIAVMSVHLWRQRLRQSSKIFKIFKEIYM